MRSRRGVVRACGTATPKPASEPAATAGVRPLARAWPKLELSTTSPRRQTPTSPQRRKPRHRKPKHLKVIDLERLVGLWPAVMDQVKSGSELLSHALSVARPIAVDVEQAVVQVGFPVSAGFNKRKAEAVEAKEMLADAVKTIVGERLRPVYVILEGEEAPTGGASRGDEPR